MSSTLHISNGDYSINITRQADDIQGDFMTWRDLLHEGPVPASPEPGE